MIYIYSGIVVIDNIYSAYMSYGPDDLIGDLQNYNRVITGFRGTHHFDVFVGTLK